MLAVRRWVDRHQPWRCDVQRVPLWLAGGGIGPLGTLGAPRVVHPMHTLSHGFLSTSACEKEISGGEVEVGGVVSQASRYPLPLCPTTPPPMSLRSEDKLFGGLANFWPGLKRWSDKF